MSTARRDSRIEAGGPPQRTAAPGRHGLAAAAALALTAAPGLRAEAQQALDPTPTVERPVAYESAWPPPVLGGTKCPPGHPVATTITGPAPVPVTPTPPPATCREEAQMGRWQRFWYRTKRKHQAAWLGYPEEFNERPFGRSLYANEGAQVSNGEAARMVFYEYDFVDGTAELNLRGRDKLAGVAGRLPTTFFPVVIERTPRAPGLDQARRMTLLSMLANDPYPVPPERVLIGPPIAYGRMGVDAIRVEGNRLGSVSAGGAAGGAAAAGVGTGSGSNPFDNSGLSGGAVAGGAR